MDLEALLLLLSAVLLVLLVSVKLGAPWLLSLLLLLSPPIALSAILSVGVTAETTDTVVD